MKEQTKKFLEAQVEYFGFNKAGNEIRTIKDKIEETQEFMMKLENAQSDPEKTEFQKICDMQYELEWLQNSIMRMYQSSIKLTETVSSARATLSALEADRKVENGQEI